MFGTVIRNFAIPRWASGSRRSRSIRPRRFVHHATVLVERLIGKKRISLHQPIATNASFEGRFVVYLDLLQMSNLALGSLSTVH